EAGKRYGEKLAGWWFDDGSMNYYYRSPDWKSIYISAKAGNPHRVITFNPWELPPASEFMDFYSGETIEDPSSNGWLVKGGNGKLTGGTYKGLQASAAIITGKEWGHFLKDSAIQPIRWTPQQLAGLLHS